MKSAKAITTVAQPAIETSPLDVFLDVEVHWYGMCADIVITALWIRAKECPETAKQHQGQ
jgi:hypothetical protein